MSTDTSCVQYVLMQWFANANILRLILMAIRVVEFLIEGTKLERFLSKNQQTQRKLLNFENWVNGEVSKSAKI